MSQDPGAKHAHKISRRSFLIAAGLAGGTSALGAYAVQASSALGAPSEQVTPPGATATPSPTAAAPTAAAPQPVPPAQPLTAPRLIDKPLPPQFFIPLVTNAEMRFETLPKDQFTVPNSLFFVRNHVASVVIDARDWVLSIEGSGINRPFTLNYDDLLRLPATTITRYVDCAGNGRSFYDTLLQMPAQGSQWHLGGYGTATWTGVPLSTLLSMADVKPSATEVMPIGLDAARAQRPMTISKAMEPDTMLVYLMNGDLLPIDHGFPARVIVPGWVGVNSIKWVGTIMVTEEHNAVGMNTTTYVLVGPDFPAPPGALGPPVNEQVMKSAVALPFPATLASGQQTVFGYAWSPNGQVTQVEVSIDGGQSFSQAQLIDPNIERAGVRWSFTFDAQPGNITITPRASDALGTQPPLSEQKWNQLGYIFAAPVPHPVTVVPRGKSG